jgi:Na+/H+ antiporter NhaB
VLSKGSLAQAAFFPLAHQFCHLAGFLYLCHSFLATKIRRSYQRVKMLVAMGLPYICDFKVRQMYLVFSKSQDLPGFCF